MVLLPKKYPRLLLALLPVGGVILGSVENRLTNTTKSALVATLLTTLGLYSLVSIPLPSLQGEIDDRCSQEWLRPPSSITLHYPKVASAAEKAKLGAIAVLNNPSIPCSIQSTHDWGYHLDPYLRRRQINREIIFVEEEDSSWKNAAVQIKWFSNHPIDDPNAIQITIQEK